MKTIIAVVVLIIAIIVIDRYDLLRPDPRYPDQLNRLIHKIMDSPENPDRHIPESMSDPSETRSLFQWKDENGKWVIADKPPADRPYKTITLTDEPVINNLPEASIQSESNEILDEQTLLKQSQCSYFAEQIARYKERGKFGGTSAQVEQWQQQIKSYQKQYFQNGCAEVSAQ